MATSALEQIAAIQAKADADIAALKQQAVSDLARKLSEARELVKSLESQYESLTGKTVSGEKAGGTRRRLTSEQKEVLTSRIKAILESSRGGIKLSALVAQTGESANAVRSSIKALGSSVKTTGARATTLYLLR